MKKALLKLFLLLLLGYACTGCVTLRVIFFPNRPLDMKEHSALNTAMVLTEILIPPVLAIPAMYNVAIQSPRSAEHWTLECMGGTLLLAECVFIGLDFLLARAIAPQAFKKMDAEDRRMEDP
ncbi:MAG: hypothetical protein ACYS47_01480 [Planctomycetota bacterium]|jgi:hypothetical protein